MNENTIRRITVIAATAALVASLAAATAGPVSAANGPKKDFVAGGGQNLASGVGPAVDAFQISAHNAGATPGAAKGSMSFKRIGTQDRLNADVTCLYVYGDYAYVTGTVTTPFEPWSIQIGDTVVAVFLDNEDGPDMVRFSPLGLQTGVPGCLYPWEAPVPVTKGNVVVNNAP